METNNLPKDPVILLSVVNTKLRDYYSNFQDMCEDMQLDEREIVEKLSSIDYTYDNETHQFI